MKVGTMVGGRQVYVQSLDGMENIHYHYYGVWKLENTRGMDVSEWDMEFLEF